MATYKLIHGDCIEVMSKAKPESVHSCVCDPPYALSFMGSEWDSPQRMIGMATGVSGGFQGIPAGVPRPDVSKQDPHLFQRWCQAWAEQALHVLKPGGHALVFGSPRTYHRLAAGLEDAGFEIRDCLMWCYSVGMPKGRDIGRQIDKALGQQGEVVGETTDDGMAGWNSYRHGQYDEAKPVRELRAPVSEWSGWSSTMKPFFEPILMARKPFKGPLYRNVMKHGTGGINVDGCRIPYESEQDAAAAAAAKNPGTDESVTSDVYGADRKQQSVSADGRWPANLMLDEGAAEALDAQAAGASRFVYIAKPTTRERRSGLTDEHSKHPTVKPVNLMRYLVRLVTPPGGVVLDPFLGSGSTGIAAMLEGFKFVGIEREEEYMDIARARMAHWEVEADGADR